MFVIMPIIMLNVREPFISNFLVNKKILKIYFSILEKSILREKKISYIFFVLESSETYTKKILSLALFEGEGENFDKIFGTSPRS